MYGRVPLLVPAEYVTLRRCQYLVCEPVQQLALVEHVRLQNHLQPVHEKVRRRGLARWQLVQNGRLGTHLVLGRKRQIDPWLEFDLAAP